MNTDKKLNGFNNGRDTTNGIGGNKLDEKVVTEIKENKNFVTRELALSFREYGFEEGCFGYYVGKDPNVFLLDNTVNKTNFDLKSKVAFRAPLWQQGRDWLRENFGIDIVIVPVHQCFSIDKITVYHKYADQNYLVELNALEFKDCVSYNEALNFAMQKMFSYISNYFKEVAPFGDDKRPFYKWMEESYINFEEL
jgi:hypothetical protein